MALLSLFAKYKLALIRFRLFSSSSFLILSYQQNAMMHLPVGVYASGRVWMEKAIVVMHGMPSCELHTLRDFSQ